jgi:DedD protein
MDRRLKERLIGAAVLVALAVWVIPWVLDGPNQASDTRSSELRLPLPAETPPMRTETVRLDAAAPSAAEKADKEAPRPSPPTEKATAAPATAAPPSPASEPEPRAATEPARSASPAPSSSSSADGEGWMVQLGSFGEQENARRLAERVTTYGFEARVSTYRAGGRLMHRVRVGPEESRARAEAVASSLAAHGFVAQVVSQ